MNEVRSNDTGFDIVTYCSAGFTNCLQWSVESWKLHSGASKIIVYTDSGTPVIPPGDSEHRQIHKVRSDDDLVSWDRKIDVLEDHAKRAAPGRLFVWLDADCWTEKPIQGIFDCLGSHACVAGSRLIGRCIRGQASANAGVIAFRNHPALADFFSKWKERSKKLRGVGPITKQNKWHEQVAFSRLVVEAFDGLHPFRSAVFSENLYNCEDDNVDKWLDRIRRYRPRILHFKGVLRKDASIKRRAFLAMQGKL